jgi:hypothetical protein
VRGGPSSFFVSLPVRLHGAHRASTVAWHLADAPDGNEFLICEYLLKTDMLGLRTCSDRCRDFSYGKINQQGAVSYSNSTVQSRDYDSGDHRRDR